MAKLSRPFLGPNISSAIRIRMVPSPKSGTVGTVKGQSVPLNR